MKNDDNNLNEIILLMSEKHSGNLRESEEIAKDFIKWHNIKILEMLTKCNVYDDFDGDKVIRVSDIKQQCNLFN